MGLLVIEAGFLFAQSFFVLMLLFALGELALFAGQAPCSKPPFPLSIPATILYVHVSLDACSECRTGHDGFHLVHNVFDRARGESQNN